MVLTKWQELTLLYWQIFKPYKLNYFIDKVAEGMAWKVAFEYARKYKK